MARNHMLITYYKLYLFISVAARSEAWVCDCGFESRWGHGCLYIVSVVCCKVPATS
jgi:hypothetical protein